MKKSQNMPVEFSKMVLAQHFSTGWVVKGTADPSEHLLLAGYLV
jgi:hypothetical protein